MFVSEHHQEALADSNHLGRVDEDHDFGSSDDDSSVEEEIPSFLRDRKVSKGMATGMNQPSLPQRKNTIHGSSSIRPAGHNSMVDPAASLAPPVRSNVARRNQSDPVDSDISKEQVTREINEANKQTAESANLDSEAPESMEEMQHRVLCEGYVWIKQKDEKRWNRRMKKLTLKNKAFGSTRLFQQHDNEKNDPNRKYVVLLYNGTLLFFRSEQERKEHINLEKVRYLDSIVAASNQGEQVVTFVQARGRKREYTVASEREMSQWVTAGESILFHQ